MKILKSNKNHGNIAYTTKRSFQCFSCVIFLFLGWSYKKQYRVYQLMIFRLLLRDIVLSPTCWNKKHIMQSFTHTNFQIHWPITVSKFIFDLYLDLTLIIPIIQMYTIFRNNSMIRTIDLTLSLFLKQSKKLISIISKQPTTCIPLNESQS